MGSVPGVLWRGTELKKTVQGECSSPEAAFPEGIRKMNWHDVSDVKHSCFSKGEVTCHI